MKKWWYKKNEINFFVSHKNESLFIFGLVIIFLLLCDNKNIWPWHNILNYVQNKIWCCTKNNFVLKQKVWCCTKSNLVSIKTCWCCRKSISYHQKKVNVAQKSISYRQKQDNAALKKNILCAKKLFFSGTARHKMLLLRLYYFFYITFIWKNSATNDMCHE